LLAHRRRRAEDLVSDADDNSDQQHECEYANADRDHDKQQAAGNDTRYQQPDCQEHDRQDDAKPDHARTPLEA
jgi:hypothetical protein